MPSTTPERAARWPGGDSEAMEFLRAAGYTLTPRWTWVPPAANHDPSERELDAVIYLIEEWDFDGVEWSPQPGPCAKTQVEFVIHSRNDMVVRGRNDCLNPQPVCPRAPGEGYEKCKSICRQVGHAEIVALDAARAAGIDVSISKGNLYGHDHICEPCRDALFKAGMKLATVYGLGSVPPAIEERKAA